MNYICNYHNTNVIIISGVINCDLSWYFHCLKISDVKIGTWIITRKDKLLHLTKFHNTIWQRILNTKNAALGEWRYRILPWIHNWYYLEKHFLFYLFKFAWMNWWVNTGVLFLVITLLDWIVSCSRFIKDHKFQ